MSSDNLSILTGIHSIALQIVESVIMKQLSYSAHHFIVRRIPPGIEVQIGIREGQSIGSHEISLLPHLNANLKTGLPFYSVARSDT